jgi:hypothetical protein
MFYAYNSCAAGACDNSTLLRVSDLIRVTRTSLIKRGTPLFGQDLFPLYFLSLIPFYHLFLKKYEVSKLSVKNDSSEGIFIWIEKVSF